MRTYLEVVAQRVVQALQRGQKHKRELCAALNCGYENLDPTMREMLKRGDIIILGTARQAGYAGIKAVNAKVYGLPGMTLQPAAKKPSGKGSGQFAAPVRIGRGMVWGAGY